MPKEPEGLQEGPEGLPEGPESKIEWSEGKRGGWGGGKRWSDK